ncbi:MAG: FadR family transcriptional regulator [Chloroflexota bacterium]|nr:FadR family transcriptional regulator [Chloroflexota bacterium]
MTGQTTSLSPTRAELSAELEEAILSGRLAVGEKLPSERELAERHGVSRPVVREAMRGLAGRNLVEVVPGRGAYVRAARATDAAAGMDALLRRHQATARDVVEARTMLECTAAESAATRATSADLAAIERALERFDRADGLIDQTRYDLAFHMAIVRASGNPVIATMFGAITGLTIELMLRSLGDPGVTSISVPYHRAIRDAICAREPERARKAMADHLAVAARTYGADFDRNLESVARRELARLFSPDTTLDDLLGAVPDGATDGGGRPT